MAKKVKKKFIPHDIEHDYYINYCKSDGRVRASHKKTGKGVSYPRLIMENHLGRYLDKNEDVHHIDGNKSNNDIDNLEVIDHVEHEKQHNPKYHPYDVFKKCPVCGITFQWTEDRQKSFYKNLKRSNKENRYLLGKPFCSKRCVGIYGKRIQLKQNKYKNL